MRCLALFVFIVTLLLQSPRLRGQAVPRLTEATWKLARVQSVEGFHNQPPFLEFRLTVNADGTMLQGLYPEGQVQSTWRFDPVRMRLHARDADHGTVYALRVLLLRNDALVLEGNDLGERTIMHYERLR